MFCAVFLIIAVYPLFFGQALRMWALATGAAFAAVAFLAPVLLAPLNRVWTLLGILLHRVTSPVALGVMFFLIITPLALVMRWLGKDLLRLGLDRAAPSYWIERSPPGPRPDTFTDQF